MIGAAQPTAVKTSSEPIIRSAGPGRVIIEHSGLVGSLPRLEPITESIWHRGDAIFQIDITPNIEAWLTRMSAYQRYRFRNIAFTMVPTVPTVEAGRVLGAFEADVDSPVLVNKGEATMRNMASLSSAVMVDVWSTHTFVKSFREDVNNWYYVSQSGVEPRTNVQGRFSIVAADVPADWDPGNFADLMVSYEVELDDPVLAPSPVLGMFGQVAGGANLSNTYPWGDIDKVTHPGFVDADSVPVCGSSVPVVYSKTLMGAFGSYFQVPRGYWAGLFHISSDGDVTNIACSWHGSYDALSTDGLGFDTFFAAGASGHEGVRVVFFQSSGFGQADAVSITLSTAGTAPTGAEAIFIALGGQPKWSNPLMSLLQEMEMKIGALKPIECSPVPVVVVPSTLSSTTSMVRKTK
jgi:hypothetical protein